MVCSSCSKPVASDCTTTSSSARLGRPKGFVPGEANDIAGSAQYHSCSKSTWLVQASGPATSFQPLQAMQSLVTGVAWALKATACPCTPASNSSFKRCRPEQLCKQGAAAMSRSFQVCSVRDVLWGGSCCSTLRSARWSARVSSCVSPTSIFPKHHRLRGGPTQVQRSQLRQPHECVSKHHGLRGGPAQIQRSQLWQVLATHEEGVVRQRHLCTGTSLGKQGTP